MSESEKINNPCQGPVRVLIAPLDWGLGHATRCIPIVQELLLGGHEVVLAADGNGEHILREAFPELQFIDFEGYRLSYSKYLPAWLKLILQLPRIIGVMRREHKTLQKIADQHQIDIVISDNRTGYPVFTSASMPNAVTVCRPSRVFLGCPLTYLNP